MIIYVFITNNDIKITKGLIYVIFVEILYFVFCFIFIPIDLSIFLFLCFHLISIILISIYLIFEL